LKRRQVDIAIIGAGSAGLYALGKVRASGRSFVLIDGGELGTTCARVGCMPSKAMIQVAEDFHRRRIFDRCGIEGGEGLRLDIPEALEYVRDLRDTFVDRVLAHSTDSLDGEHFIQGQARFLSPEEIEVDGMHIQARRFIVATGSRPLVPAQWQPLGEHILTTDNLFEQPDLPERMAVIGLGVIGLELGQALARWGIEVSGFEMREVIGEIGDAEVNRRAIDILGRDLDLHLGAAAELEPAGDGVRVVAGEQRLEVQRVLACLGRVPNVAGLGLENLGLELDARGLPPFDPQTMQVADLPLFLAGDVTGQRPVLHEAGDEGRIAAINALADSPRRFRRKVPMTILFTDPEICRVGTPLDRLPEADTIVGEVALAPVGRALIMGRNRGLIRVYARRRDGCLLGAEMITPRAENLAHLLAWAMEQGLGVGDLLRMPFYHPVLEEALQAALYQAYAEVDAKNEGPITELRPWDDQQDDAWR